MKPILTVLWLALAVSSFALTPGPTIIRECPSCKEPLKQFTIGSGNNFGATFWTDGKMEAPMWPDKPALVNCPHCMKTFWLEDVKQLAELDLFRRDAAKHWETAKVVVDPVETNYLAAANAPGVKLDRELYARRHAWWLANDAVRRQADGQLVWNAAQRNNLQRLAALLSDKDSCEGLQKGEIFRELGNYDACIKLLDGLPTDSNTTKMNADILKNLAIQKKSTVARWP